MPSVLLTQGVVNDHSPLNPPDSNHLDYRSNDGLSGLYWLNTQLFDKGKLMLRVQIIAKSDSFTLKMMCEPSLAKRTEAWLQRCLYKMEAENCINVSSWNMSQAISDAIDLDIIQSLNLYPEPEPVIDIKHSIRNNFLYEMFTRGKVNRSLFTVPKPSPKGLDIYFKPECARKYPLTPPIQPSN